MSGMMHTAQCQSPSRDKGLGHPTESEGTRKPQTAHLTPSGDSASDGDAGERPIREKLKKTSIASIPKYGIAEANATFEEPEEHSDTVMASQEVMEEIPAGTWQADTDTNERGRPHKKRSFDDIDAVETSKDTPLSASMSAHARKRSRDVRSVEGTKSASHRRSPEASVREESEALESQKQDSALRDELEDTTIKENASKPPSETTDHEMQESVLSPKKKRSRDQFESESHREQKIAATDENRARRRSSEEDRPETAGAEIVESKSDQQSNQNGDVVFTTKPPEEIQAEKPKSTLPPRSGFADTSATSPFSTFSNKPSIFKTPSLSGTNNSNQETQTSSSAFASSGFAALAGSSTSPFSTLGTTSTSYKSPPPESQSHFASSTATEASTRSGFGNSGPTSFASTGKSSFASAGVSGFGTLGGSGFGSAFGGGFGGGTKLSSFAAPAGDTKLGGTKPKPFGASEDSDEEDSASEGENDRPVERLQETEAESSKFHLQEVETGEQDEDTIFSNRGKLYRFVEKKWAERGVGLFKLNIKRRDTVTKNEKDETVTQPRFVMRTQATHKVILNAPVFKEMKISDLDGKEPSGKAAMFSVYVEGKLTPHLLKMSKEDDIKALYHKVQRLQKDL